MSDGDGLLYDGEHIFYCITHGAIQRVDPVDKCVVTRRGEDRAECEFVDAVVGGRVVSIDLEAAAALEHDQWALWTAHMLDNLTPDNIARWRRQIETPYAELTKKEQDKDREWAFKAAAALGVDDE